MKQRMIALTLTLTLLLAAAVSAFAVEPAAKGEETVPAAETQQQTETAPETAVPEGAVTEDGAVEEPTQEAPALETTDVLLIAPAPAPAPAGKSVNFYDLEELVKKNNLNYLSLRSTIDYMKELEDTEETLDKSIQQLKGAIAALDPGAAGYETQAAYLNGKLAEAQQAKAAISPMIQDTSKMGSGCCQIIWGAETLYIALVGMEQQETALERKLTSLDRTIEELKVRAQWGQVSQLQLKEAESGRGSLVSGLTTLRMNITSCKMQLEQMLGEKTTGTMVLEPLPVVSAEQLGALDPEADLKEAKKKNFDLRAAEAAEWDAVAATTEMGSLSVAMELMADAAGYAADEAAQQVELKFRLLNLQLQDQRQVLAAAVSALETERLAYQAQELKYQQGAISKNALLTAEDELKTAQEAVQTAQDNLFSTYNNYRWAVDHGLLN